MPISPGDVLGGPSHQPRNWPVASGKRLCSSATPSGDNPLCCVGKPFCPRSSPPQQEGGQSPLPQRPRRGKPLRRGVHPPLRLPPRHRVARSRLASLERRALQATQFYLSIMKNDKSKRPSCTPHQDFAREMERMRTFRQLKHRFALCHLGCLFHGSARRKHADTILSSKTALRLQTAEPTPRSLSGEPEGILPGTRHPPHHGDRTPKACSATFPNN